MLEAPRRLRGWLLVGMVMAPLLFVWFLLRRGYSRRLRLAGFTYAAVMFASALLGIWASASEGVQ